LSVRNTQTMFHEMLILFRLLHFDWLRMRIPPQQIGPNMTSTSWVSSIFNVPKVPFFGAQNLIRSICVYTMLEHAHRHRILTQNYLPEHYTWPTVSYIAYWRNRPIVRKIYTYTKRRHATERRHTKSQQHVITKHTEYKQAIINNTKLFRPTQFQKFRCYWRHIVRCI